LFCVVGCVVCTTWWLLIHFLYLFCHTVFPLVIFFRFFFLQSQIFYIHRFWY
jgi:hypothetical protein